MVKKDNPKINTNVGMLINKGYKKKSRTLFAESVVKKEKPIPTSRMIKFNRIKIVRIPSDLPAIYCALVIERAYITSTVSFFLSCFKNSDAKKTATMACPRF